MKRDMSTIRHEVETVHQVKEEMDDLRGCVDKIEEQNRRRKLRLLEQVRTSHPPPTTRRVSLSLSLSLDSHAAQDAARASRRQF